MLHWMCAIKLTNDMVHRTSIRSVLNGLAMSSRASYGLVGLRVLVLEEGHARAGRRTYKRTSGYPNWNLGMLITELCEEPGKPCSVRPTSQ